MDLRLGRRPTPPEIRAQTPKLRDYLATLPAAPASLDLTSGVTVWPIYANDRLGDCTCAAAGHMLEIWSYQVDSIPRLVGDQDVIALYETQGYNPADPSTDQGATLVGVMQSWRQVGLAGDPILGWAEVSVSDRAELLSACWLFSGLYLGVNLPIAAQGQFQSGQTWDVVSGPDGAPGSWGGHCVDVVAYDAAGLTVVTWGQLQRCTWAWFEAYCDEVAVIIPKDYDRLNGRLLANGFDEARLIADLDSIGGNVPQPTPGPTPPPSPVPPPPVPPSPVPPPPRPPAPETWTDEMREWWDAAVAWYEHHFGSK